MPPSRLPLLLLLPSTAFAVGPFVISSTQQLAPPPPNLGRLRLPHESSPLPGHFSSPVFPSYYSAATRRRAAVSLSSSRSSFKDFPPFGFPFLYLQTQPITRKHGTVSLWPKRCGIQTWYPAKASNPPGSVGERASTTVVLLGWLGAQQRHLKKYADLYLSRGFQVVAFTLPLKDIFHARALDNAETQADALVEDLLDWLDETGGGGGGHGKHLIFHSFSNTGWLMYGAVLERLIARGGETWLGMVVRGCVVDSAPCKRPDARVWASGFTAAILKKGSSSTTGGLEMSLTEMFLRAMLERFFSLFLRIPRVNARLNDLASVLSHKQPACCRQMYIYSTADSVIPVESVEEFVEEQREAGRSVTTCNFQVSPHVDHLRTFPDEYDEQLEKFLEECMLP